MCVYRVYNVSVCAWHVCVDAVIYSYVHIYLTSYSSNIQQAELWFHDGGLTEVTLAEQWCKISGGASPAVKGLNFGQFNELYNQVCQFKYQA